MANLQTRIKNKHDTEAHWNSATNFTPLDGEIIVYDVDSTHPYPRYKVGDGETVVTALPFSTDILDDYLKQAEYSKYQVLRNVAYNVTRVFDSNTGVQDIVIYTKIKWVSSQYMPVIHLYGYAYGLHAPIELKIGFYIYNDSFDYCGVTCMGSWKPSVYGFKYTDEDDGLDYVAIGFKTIQSDWNYYYQFEVDLQVEHGLSWATTNGNITLTGWSNAVVTWSEESIIPDVGQYCTQVPYVPIPGYVITDGTTTVDLENFKVQNENTYNIIGHSMDDYYDIAFGSPQLNPAIYYKDYISIPNPTGSGHTELLPGNSGTIAVTNDITTALTNYVTRNTEQILNAHKTFNSSASGTLPITVTSNDVTNQMGMSSTAIWTKPSGSSTWYSASLQAKNGTLAYTSDIPETGNYVYGSDGVKNTNLSVISRDASNDRVYVGNDLDNLVLYGTSPHPYYSQTNGEFGVELALVSDIPNTSNFITNTQLDSAINGITIDDGTL